MTCCRLFGLRRVIHAPCKAIVQATSGEMSMSDPLLFQPNAPLLPMGRVVAFATALPNCGWSASGRWCRVPAVSMSNTRPHA